MAQKVHAQLYFNFLSSFIIITPLPSTSLRSELQLLSISEIGILHTLSFTVGDRPFGVTVTRHFRLKSTHSTETIYCKPINRALNAIQGGVRQLSRTNYSRVLEFF